MTNQYDGTKDWAPCLMKGKLCGVTNALEIPNPPSGNLAKIFPKLTSFFLLCCPASLTHRFS